MKKKICPECGAAIDAELDHCPDCGLSGLNKTFLTSEDYAQWENRELLPRKNGGKGVVSQVFAGANHVLILRPNGDLYAMGNNCNGCCGDHLPTRLTEFTRIAGGVIHAAAGKNHSLLVNRKGEVILLGNSEYTDRFTCDLTARRVYAHPEFDAFLIEDAEGKLYFFGDRDSVKLIPAFKLCLEALPRICERVRDSSIWGFYERPGTSMGSGYRMFHTVLSGCRNLDQMPAVQEALRSDWYRQYAREYGEQNVGITLSDCVKSVTVSDETIPSQGYMGDQVTVTDCYYEPYVYLDNKIIYTPLRCPDNVQLPEENCCYGCWPVKLPGYALTEELRRAGKVILGTYEQVQYPHTKAALDSEGKVTFQYHLTRNHEPISLKEKILDCAISPVDSFEDSGNLILLVTESGAVYQGSREKLMEATQIRTGMNRHLPRISVKNLLTKISFPEF